MTLTAPFLPADAPFSPEQRAWLMGFLSGLGAHAAATDSAETSSGLTVDVLVGTQTGNAEYAGEDVAAAARAAGFGANLTALDDVSMERLAAMTTIVVVTSTYGEGEMPDNAELFWEALASETAPRLESARFAVLALGDSGYDGFCQAGKLIDTRLEQLGAERFEARVDCDVDYEDAAAEWTANVIARLVALAPDQAGSPASVAAPVGRARSPWNRKTPFGAELAVNRLLSSPTSAKEIRHLEFALAESGIEYAAGDALGVVPRNDPALVAALIEALGVDAGEATPHGELRDALVEAYEIRTPSKELIARLADDDPESELGQVVALGQKETLEAWLWGRDILDLLLGTRVRWPIGEFVELLRPLQHRAYSISSSPLASPDRIHLTVASVRFDGAHRRHGGVASTFLADRVGAGETAGVFVSPNTAFRVPADDAVPMIMVGPGTGVAPFRAFLQERAGRGARGRNWLFFGDQHRSSDYIYEEELETYRQDGVLDRLDLAFSRDQAEKVYVQSRMAESGADLFAWLEDGAHFYVCGDASRMAKDVDDALHAIVEVHGGLDHDGATEYVNTLKREKRYVRDVY
ncbi:diflavin oxidoreductase [Agromyces atrinae]|uniref:assimilatory sulfite reductase (NADPH) n=1 Tax=Agromyces atrinae TaxID=592376 RepID=A0A4Q2M4C8_9MICO|nr:sulfite reductase flavoprotein subunit alpha [Agromyces atrinae]NYD67254.1 sulfite reductase (NADPH) flavoprotein alpha-component [Agromyces atrinae]RXZ86914.1 sulfite reductase flavoprotein subunit alpha [Agromyces atrinae]